MSYNAKHSISIICPNKAVANEITEYFRDYICRSDDEAWADGKTVGVCTFGDIDNEDLAMLTAKYPGTFLTDEYYGEDYEIGVIYTAFVIVIRMAWLTRFRICFAQKLRMWWPCRCLVAAIRVYLGMQMETLVGNAYLISRQSI